MKELLKFSSKGKVYDVDKLLSNLLELVKIRRSAYIQRFSWENIYIYLVVSLSGKTCVACLLLFF